MLREIRIAFAVMAVFSLSAWAQAPITPTNDAPNPYQTIENFFKMPEGRTWGATSAIAVDKDGKSIWVAERCGQNSCVADPTTGKMSDIAAIMKFDPSGKMVKSFGTGMFAFPHGMFVDKDGNIWVTDGNDNAPRAARGAPRGAAGAAGARGAAAAAPATPPAAGAPAAAAGARGAGPTILPGSTIGHLVYKFSPEGKLLMTLGKTGGATEPDYFYQPNAVYVDKNGEIYVSEGHSSGANANARILKFSKDGKLIRSFGKKGTGPGEFDQPHALAMDSKGRLYVGDRSNNRIQIFDKNFKFIAEWKQFSRPSGVFIDKKTDTIYVADSESGSVNPPHGAWKRGIRIGKVKDGKVLAFIPDPGPAPNNNTSTAEGMTVDAAGNVYGAEVGQRAVKKYVKK